MSLEGMRVVGGEGPKRPKLILVGESLGEEEEKVGRPFVGTDGKILDGILTSSRIRREDCYITNVVKVRPPGSKVRRLAELGITISDFIPSLKVELSGIDCNVCVPLGDVALNVICGKDGITKHRGSIYSTSLLAGREILCVPTYNPGFVREFWQSRGVVVEDLKKAVRVAEKGIEKVEFNTLTLPALGDVESFVHELMTLPEFSFDIETLSGNQIACVGIGGVFNGQRRSLCIPFKHGYRNYWERYNELFVWKLLRQLFQSDALKIGQFINFDLTFLLPFLGEPTPPWFDTSVAHHCLDPELPHNLAFLTSLYTDVPYYKDDPKDEGESWKRVSSSEQLWEYNGKDVEIPLILRPKLEEEMREAGVLDFFRGYQMPLLRVMWRVQTRGMQVDLVKRKELLAERVVKVEKVQTELEQRIGHEINVNSSKQMMRLVYDELHLPIQYHRKTRRPTVDKEALEKLFSRYPNEIFKMALDVRGLVKEIGTYLEDEIRRKKVAADGRVRTRYNVCGTETGRSSSSKTVFGDGIDLQNVPEDLRVMFIPAEGKVFKIYDLWQAEAYCVAIFANSQSFLNKLRKGEKIHSMVGSWIFRLPESEITSDKNPVLYALAKRTVHGKNYGEGWQLFMTLANTEINEFNEAELNVSKHRKALTATEAKEILQVYSNYAPEIEAWHKEVEERLVETRRLVTPFGRVRIFRGRIWKNDLQASAATYREGYAHLPQSTIADYAHQAMLKLEYALPNEAELVQEGFDSFIIECYPNQSEEIDCLVEVAFDKTLLWKGEEFKIPYEGKERVRWAK